MFFLNRVRGCSDKRFCRGKKGRHGLCINCGQLTCGRGLWVDPQTLRRRIMPICWQDLMAGGISADSRTRLRRAETDWEIPVVKMNDQYPSVSRLTLRSFIDSNEDVQTVDNRITPNVLNSTIEALGFANKVYAEQRGRTTVLRRVNCG